MTYSGVVQVVSRSNGMLRGWRPSAGTVFVVAASVGAKGLVKIDGTAHIPTIDDVNATDWQAVQHGSYVAQA